MKVNSSWKTWMKGMGIAGFCFFLIKGLFWLFLFLRAWKNL